MRLRGLIAAALAAASMGAAARAQDVAAVFEAAVADAIARSADAPRFSFTQTVVNLESGQRLVARFNPEGPEGARWSLMEPALEALEGEALQFWDRMRVQDEADIELLADDIEDMAPVDASYAGESEGRSVYRGVMPEASEDDEDRPPRAMREAVTAEVIIDNAEQRLESYRLVAERAFRPNALARVTDFEMTIDFAEAWDEGPLVIARVSQAVSGSALFQSFNERFSITNDGFTPVEGAGEAP